MTRRPAWPRDPAVARLLADALRASLLDRCVPPNVHVHPSGPLAPCECRSPTCCRFVRPRDG